MAKSLRAKNRQAAGRKRRATGHYAAAEAARVQRLSEKLLGKGKEKENEEEEEEVKVDEDGDVDLDGGDVAEDAQMAEDTPKVSTSGKRGSRREQWRASKGMLLKKSKNARGQGLKSSKASKPKRRR